MGLIGEGRVVGRDREGFTPNDGVDRPPHAQP